MILKEVHWLLAIVSNEAVLYLSDLIVIYVPGSTNLRSTKSDVLILKKNRY